MQRLVCKISSVGKKRDYEGSTLCRRLIMPLGMIGKTRGVREQLWPCQKTCSDWGIFAYDKCWVHFSVFLNLPLCNRDAFVSGQVKRTPWVHEKKLQYPRAQHVHKTIKFVWSFYLCTVHTCTSALTNSKFFFPINQYWENQVFLYIYRGQFYKPHFVLFVALSQLIKWKLLESYGWKMR